MTEYDYSPEAYDRYIQTQIRIATWIQHTEQHRQLFEAAVPGAPGVPPVLRRPSPPLPSRYTPPKKLPSTYTTSPIYHRSPPSSSSSSSSEGSFVHVPSPHTRAPRQPPLPIYIPPPGFTSYPIHPHPTPIPARVMDHHHRTSSSRPFHHRSQSQSHSHSGSRRPPPLVTPIYTSPPASPYYPSARYVLMSPRGYPAPGPIAPLNHPSKTPKSPPITPSASTSSTPSSGYNTSAPRSPNSFPFPPSQPAVHVGPSSSGLGSHSQIHPPWREERDKIYKPHQRMHSSLADFPGIDSPYLSRGLQQSNLSQRHDNHVYSNRTRKSNFPAYKSPTGPRPHPPGDSHERSGPPSRRRESSEPRTNATGVIPISVPAARHPELVHQESTPLSRTNQDPIEIHAPQPTRHHSVFRPQLRASARG